MAKKTVVAHIVGKMMSGGVESMLLNYLSSIDQSKVEFWFIIHDDSKIVPQDYILNNGGRIYKIPSYKKPFKYWLSLYKLFSSDKPDIVHSHINALSALPLSAATAARIPIRIAHSHSTSNKKEYARHLIKLILRPTVKLFATNYAACSSYAMHWLFGKKIQDQPKSIIVKNAIQLEKFQFNQRTRQETRKSLNINESTLLIGNVGRLCQQKNQSFLINLAKLLKDSGTNDFKLVLVGAGPDRDKLNKMIAGARLSEHIAILSPTDRIADLYQAFDVLAFPSLYEGLGMVVLEAQAAGLPTIVSQHIPDEAIVVPDIVNRIPLENTTEWVNVIRSHYHSVGASRMNTIRPLQRSGYDIHDASNRLLNWYQQSLNHSRR